MNPRKTWYLNFLIYEHPGAKARRSCNVTEQDLLDLLAAGQVAMSGSHIYQLVRSGQHFLSDTPYIDQISGC